MTKSPPETQVETTWETADNTGQRQALLALLFSDTTTAMSRAAEALTHLEGLNDRP